MSESGLVLAIDLGSTWCKAACVDRCGGFISVGRVYSRLDRPESSLRQIWGLVVRAARAACNGVAGESRTIVPEGIALSCRGVFGIGLDAAGQPVSMPEPIVGPAPSGLTEALAASGFQPLDGFGYAPRLAATARRWRESQPQSWSNVRRFGALHDWVLDRLTDRWLTDPATGPGGPDWPPQLTTLTGLPIEAFPAVNSPYDLAGGLSVAAAADLGLPAGISVVVGSHDGAAANIGAGAILAGDGCLTLGSNLVLRVVTGARLAGCFGYPILDQRWAWVRGAHGIAAQLDAVVAALDGGDGPVIPARHQALTRLAQSAPLACQEAALLDVGAALAARSRGWSPGAIYSGALRQAARAVRRLLEAARSEGASPARLIATGGAAVNSLFFAALRQELDCPIAVAQSEAGLLGAAILAACGSGWYPDPEAAVAAMVWPAVLE
jgi:sugar (pentulose or hexulose) kinase